jgi:hypothetical protein
MTLRTGTLLSVHPFHVSARSSGEGVLCRLAFRSLKSHTELRRGKSISKHFTDLCLMQLSAIRIVLDLSDATSEVCQIFKLANIYK